MRRNAIYSGIRLCKGIQMLAVISPAKKLNFDPAPADVSATLPEFQADANRLSMIAKKLSVSELRKLMHISEDLGTLNRERFQAFAKASDETNSKQAMLAFAGDTYTGLQAQGFDAADREYAQDHLRILSGLYGLLRPLDRIQPYRLEMGSKLKNKAGTNLYAYWGQTLSKALDKAADGAPVVNLASNEYFKAASQKTMESPVITPSFVEERGNDLKMIGFFAKKARGAMARFIVQNRITTVEGLKDFDTDGYGFRHDLSNGSALMFTRKSE